MVNSHKNKTVVDAVNYLQGDLLNVNITAPTHPFNAIVKCIKSFNNHVNGDYYDYSDNNRSDLSYEFEFICTIDEFNQCVTEMSEGLFVPDCRPNAPEIQYDKDGNGLEVGAVYDVSDDGEAWNAGKFCRYESEKRLPFITDLNCGWMYIRECQSPIGKIHKKPIELVDGAAYQFEYIAGKFIGIYGKSDDLFYMSNRRTLSREHAKNIIKLVPESV